MPNTDSNDKAGTLIALVRRRIESRYRRIGFVHSELVKLAGKQKDGTAPGGSFEDFVFSTIDFSVYQKIPAEEFALLFDEGLSDFDEEFYRKAFGTDRENVRQTIFRSYIRVGPFYVCRKSTPLILSIMRSVHTSLEFAPLFTAADLGEGAEAEERRRSLIAALDGVVIRHDDGAETALFVPDAEDAALCGTFYPQGKAHTVILIKKADNGQNPLSALAR
jgi:hypothetical protein